MKMLFRGKEVYPSVVMPAGVALIHLSEGDLSFKFSQLYGIKKDTKKLTPLDHINFIQPAPSHFLGKIMYTQD